MFTILFQRKNPGILSCPLKHLLPSLLKIAPQMVKSVNSSENGWYPFPKRLHYFSRNLAAKYSDKTCYQLPWSFPHPEFNEVSVKLTTDSFVRKQTIKMQA